MKDLITQNNKDMQVLNTKTNSELMGNVLKNWTNEN